MVLIGLLIPLLIALLTGLVTGLVSLPTRQRSELGRVMARDVSRCPYPVPERLVWGGCRGVTWVVKRH